MSKWKKAPQEHIDIFHQVLPLDDKIEPRKMFGYDCAFVNGNMFTGLHQDNLILRLSEKDREEAFSLGWKKFEPMPGRAMKEYAAIPEELFKNIPELEKWMQKSYEFARALPPKKKKKKK